MHQCMTHTLVGEAPCLFQYLHYGSQRLLCFAGGLSGVNHGGVMRYLVTIQHASPFLTDRFDVKNNFNSEAGMVVYDLFECKFTSDGNTWHDIEFDEL